MVAEVEAVLDRVDDLLPAGVDNPVGDVATLQPEAREELVDEHVDDRGLERRRNVGHVGVRVLAHVVHDGGLQAREREIVAVGAHGAREPDRLRVAFAREPVDRRTAGVSEPAT